MLKRESEKGNAIKQVPKRNFLASIAYLGRWILSGEFKFWAVSLFLVGFGGLELSRQELSILSWETTLGTVVESQTKWLDQKKSGPIPIMVEVRYRYSVEGQEYESTRVTTGNPIQFYGVQEAAEFRKRFPPGGKITVLYAPYDPSQATLFAERGSGPWILLGFGVPFLLLTIFLHWKRLRCGEEVHVDVDIPLPPVPIP